MGVFLNQAHKGCERGNFNFVQVKYASFKETDAQKMELMRRMRR